MHSAALLALCVLLAGCAGTPAPSAEATPTLSPVPLPEDDPPSERFPPGVGPERVRNGSALADAHERALANQSYRLYIGAAYTDTALIDRNVHATVAPPRAYSRVSTRVNGTLSGYEVYTDANGTTVAANGTVGPGTDTVDTVRGDQLRAVFTAGELRVARQRTDEGHYRLWAEDLFVPVLPFEGGPIENASVEAFYATVTPRGRVVRYLLFFDGTRDGVRTVGEVRAEYTEVGRATTEPPAWL